MKRIICLLIIVCFVFTGCTLNNNNNNNNSGGKIILKLNHRINLEEEKEEDINRKSVSIKLGKIPETSQKKYENEDYFLEVKDYIKNNFSIELSDNWDYFVHYYDEAETMGFIEFMYKIGEINTNKVIMLFFENNNINSVVYKYLDGKVNEDELLNRLKVFKDTYMQEQYKLKDGEKFLEERTNYTYYYNVDKLVYSYAVFFTYGELDLINNDNASEYFIN